MINRWHNCYDSGWQGEIVPEAFSHPAKFSRGLIHRIYKHAKEMGWCRVGDYVIDPFGGVALGGLDAMSMGLNWIGIELEEKFVKLGEQNIELWNRQLKGWPNLGMARIVRGDSRRLREICSGMRQHPVEVGRVVPSSDVPSLGGKRWLHPNCGGWQEPSGEEGHCKFEKADLVVSSPPFCGAGMDSAGGNTQMAKGISEDGQRRGGKSIITGYGHTPGNLANMREGDIDLVVSSPPYAESVNSGRDGIDFSKAGRPDKMEKTSTKHYPVGAGADRDFRYGQSLGQLGSMKEGPFDLCVSSPPWETSPDAQRTCTEHGKMARQAISKMGTYRKKYGESQVSGDTFWSASREIVQGCFDLLKPRGHAIWVTKNYVKAKKIVPFSDRWQALCESVGFKLVCRYQAMLVKEHGTQMTSYGDKKITTERKSFFRRLAESKGSPRIDWEDVICMEK